MPGSSGGSRGERRWLSLRDDEVGGSYETAPPTSSIAPPSGPSLGEVVAPAVAVRETRAMEHDRREKADVARSLHDSTLAGGLIGLAVAAAAFFAAHVLRRRQG